VGNRGRECWESETLIILHVPPWLVLPLLLRDYEELRRERGGREYPLVMVSALGLSHSPNCCMWSTCYPFVGTYLLINSAWILQAHISEGG